MEPSTIDASIVIPTLGRVDAALGLSRKLGELKPKPKEIIFVFQRQDELAAWASRNTNEGTLGVLCGVMSAAAARNFGASQATGRYLVFLDDDCLPVESNWLVEIVSPLELQGALLCTGAVLGWKSASGLLLKTNRAFMVSPLLLIPWGNPASERSSWCHTVAGGNFSLERSSFVGAGGFSAAFGSPSIYEETEFSLRITSRQKKKIWFNARARVAHEQQSSGGMRSTQRRMTDEFVLAQKKILFESVFGFTMSARLRLRVYQALKRIRAIGSVVGIAENKQRLSRG